MNEDQIRETLNSHATQPPLLAEVIIPAGWIGVLEEMHNSLMQTDPFYAISDFNQKNGFYSITIKDASEEQEAIVNNALNTIWVTCADCGDEGTLRRFGDLQDPSYDTILCDDCKKAILNLDEI